MTSFINYTTSQKGKKMIVDKHNFRYTYSDKTKKVEHFRCSDRSCKARLSARISTGNLCSELPSHTHGNRLLESVNDFLTNSAEI